MRIQIFIPKEFERVYELLLELIKKDEKFKEVVKRFQDDKRIKGNKRSLMFRYIIARYVKEKREENKKKEGQKIKENASKCDNT